MSLNEELQTISGIGESKAKAIEEIVAEESGSVDMGKIEQAYRMLERGNSRAAKSCLESLIGD